MAAAWRTTTPAKSLECAMLRRNKMRQSRAGRTDHNGIATFPPKNPFAFGWAKGKEKAGRTPRARPEFREETPVTRQREDQPLPDTDNGVGSQGGTTTKAAGKSQKAGFQN
jgi:hypothetical protein